MELRIQLCVQFQNQIKKLDSILAQTFNKQNWNFKMFWKKI
jgi:hypothetical protein